MKTVPLYPYQTRVSEFAKSRPKVGIFTFYGSGKTYLSLKWLEDGLRQLTWGTFPTLVLTLKSLVHQWGEEIRKHTDLSYTLVEGTTAQRIKALEASVDIYVMNYDIVRSPAVLNAFGIIHTATKTETGKLRHHFRTTRKINFGAVIVDESTTLKESRTLRFQGLKALCQDIPFRALLTGKPILEKAEEVWSQMLFLDDGETFGRAFWKFRDTYFSPGPPWDPYDWTLKPGAETEIANKLSQKCIRIPKSEVLNELPPKRYITVKLEIPKSAREKYRELKKEFRTELPSGELFDTKWAVVKSQKMHQLCQGVVYNQEHKYELVHRVKFQWLSENVPLMLKEGPILIWTNFRSCIEMIVTTLGMENVSCASFHGGLNQKAREAVLADFQSGAFDVLVLSEQAGGAGLNLQRANQAVFFSTGYWAGARENAEDRCHRIGSEVHKSVTYYDLVMENSIDEVVLKAIKGKLDLAEAILKHIREE